MTVDAPRLGRRLRDLRNDFRLPAGIEPANLAGGDFSSPSAHALAEFDPPLDWTVVGWLRSASSLPVLLKGILTASDALRAIEAGVDGIVNCNHGGRQLDGVAGVLGVVTGKLTNAMTLTGTGSLADAGPELVRIQASAAQPFAL